MPDSDDKSYAAGDDELLKEILEFRDYAWSRSEKNRKEGDLDMKALSVTGPWPEAELVARTSTDNPRPHGHTDIISPYNNRVVNQARMNPRGVDVIPKGLGADEKTAEKRENRLRGIGYESHASAARLTALQNAVDRGIGYWQVDTEYESPRSRNLKIVVKRVANPSCILDDPDCEMSDRSDRKKLIREQWILKSAAKQRWKNLKDPASFSLESVNAASSWLRPNSMRFVEYWRVEESEDRVFFHSGLPDGVLESKMEEGSDPEAGFLIVNHQQVLIEDKRETTTRKVYKYFTNGLQIFEKEEWPGSTIPFPCCTGREKYEGDELVIESMTRKIREPQLNFDVATAGEMEQFNMATKAKILASDKAVEGYEAMYMMAHRNPQALLKWHEKSEDGTPNTKPEAIAFMAQIDGYEQARNSFIRDTQNAAGMTGVDQKQRQTESGVAQERIDEAADITSFHFIDSWLAAIEFEGRIENELLTVIEDSKRTVGFRQKDGKYKAEEIEPMQMPDGSVQHPYGDSDSHGVTISTQPDFQSQVQKAQDYAETLAKEPAFAVPLGPLIVDSMQLGPIGDKMKKILTAILPPQIAAAYQDDSGDPAQALQSANQGLQKAQGELQALNAHAKALEQQVIELTDDLKAQKIQSDSRERIAMHGDRTKIDVALIAASVKESIAKMEEQAEMFRHFASVVTERLGIAADTANQQANRQQAAVTASQNGDGSDV